MSPRPDVSEERKTQILAAATKVFTERGFADARMDDIVTEAGLSKGALYWYFDSKDAIIISILDQIFDYETGHVRELLKRENSAKLKLEVFIETMVKDLEKMKPLMPIFFDFWSLSLRKKTINQAIKKYYQRFLDMIEPIIEAKNPENSGIFESPLLKKIRLKRISNFPSAFKASMSST